jgi:ATP-dependent DNA helicase RecG
MNLAELHQRIEQWENLHTEFKEWPIHITSCAESLVAFANTDGGQLIFGVRKDKSISGVPDPDRAMQWVDNIAYNNCEPPVTVLQETVKMDDGRIVVIVNVPQGDLRPYRTNQGDYFIRTTSGKRRASRQELLRLFQAAESFYYDETLVLRATIGDLDSRRFDRFVQQAYQQPLEAFSVPYETLLQNLNLLRRYEGALHPTVACLLFFAHKPLTFLPHAYVTAARIPGSDLTAPPTDAKQIEGPLLDILEDTARFLRIHLQTAHHIQGFAPEAYPELPEVALREVLVNALAHRDYTVAAPVRVFVYDDRVEVRTPGGLPNTVTIDAIRLGAAHVTRNPTVYTFFSRWGLVTGIGSGVYRTIQAVKAVVGREPMLRVEANEFIVTLPRKRTGTARL